MNLLGSPWHLLVLRDVMLGRNTREKILSCKFDTISVSELDLSIRALVDLNIIEVQSASISDANAQLRLSAVGKTLEPLIKEYAKIGAHYFEGSVFPAGWDT